MQASLKPPFAITFFSTFAFLVSINCGNMHCLRAVWNISNDGIILWIPYWLSIAYVNAFNHVKLKSRDLTLSFQKGKGGRVQWRDTNAKAINIHPLCLSQLFHMAIANFMPRIRHQCPHLRIQRGPVLLLSSTVPRPVLLAETWFLNTNQGDDLCIRHRCCMACPSTITTVLTASAPAVQTMWPPVSIPPLMPGSTSFAPASANAAACALDTCHLMTEKPNPPQNL